MPADPDERRRLVGAGCVLREILEERGIASVNVADDWARTHGLKPSMVVAIVRGRREGVLQRRESGEMVRDPDYVTAGVADAIVTALAEPMLWRGPLLRWYFAERYTVHYVESLPKPYVVLDRVTTRAVYTVPDRDVAEELTLNLNQGSRTAE